MSASGESQLKPFPTTRFGDSGSWPSVKTGHQTSGNETGATVSDLKPFTVYTFRVLARNGVGSSKPSEASYPVSTLRERK